MTRTVCLSIEQVILTETGSNPLMGLATHTYGKLNNVVSNGSKCIWFLTEV